MIQLMARYPVLTRIEREKILISRNALFPHVPGSRRIATKGIPL